MNLKSIHTKWVRKKAETNTVCCMVPFIWNFKEGIATWSKEGPYLSDSSGWWERWGHSQKGQYETFWGIEAISILKVVVVMIPLYAFVKTHQIVHKNWWIHIHSHTHTKQHMKNIKKQKRMSAVINSEMFLEKNRLYMWNVKCPFNLGLHC